MSTDELERLCIARWPDFTIFTGLRGEGGGYTSVANFTKRGMMIWVQRACPTMDEATLWRRLIIEQCLKEFDS